PFRDIAAGEQSHRGRDSLARGQRAQFPQAATRFSSAERGKGRCPFPRSPIPKTALQRFPTPHHSWIEPASTSLRTISLGDSEHLLHNHHVSVAALRLLFTFAPECRSASSGIDVHLHRNTHACKSQPTIFMCSAPFLRCLVGLSAPSLLGRGEPTRLSNQAPFLRSLVGLSAPSLLGRGEPTRLSNEALSRRSYRSPRPAAEISRWRFRHLRAAVRSPALGSIVFGSIVGCAFLAGVDVELLDQAAQLGGHLDQFLRCLLGVAGAPRCILGGLGYTGNIAGDLAAIARRFAHVARHLVSSRVLLLDGGGDRPGNIVDLVDDGADRCNGV